MVNTICRRENNNKAPSFVKFQWPWPPYKTFILSYKEQKIIIIWIVYHTNKPTIQIHKHIHSTTCFLDINQQLAHIDTNQEEEKQEKKTCHSSDEDERQYIFFFCKVLFARLLSLVVCLMAITLTNTKQKILISKNCISKINLCEQLKCLVLIFLIIS